MRIQFSSLLAALWLIAGTCSGHATWADAIAPSNRVETRLLVRAEPDGSSPIVGAMLPGSFARLLESDASWDKVELTDGTEGYVSKAWSKRLSTATGQIARIGVWNLKKLGHDNDKAYSLIAQLIDQHYDVLGIIEVMQKEHGHPGFDQLLSALGPGWKGAITPSPRPNTGSGNSEFYALIYRNDRAKLCDGWNALQYMEDGDGADDATGATPDLFAREPAFACVRLKASDSGDGPDFMLGLYHAIWSGGDSTKISEEVRHVLEAFPGMAEASQGENDLLLGGDFNLVPHDLYEATLMHTLVDAPGSTLNTDGEITEHDYDHLLVWNPAKTTELAGRASVLDLRSSTDTTQAFYRMVSDHLPTYIEMVTTLTDDD